MTLNPASVVRLFLALWPTDAVRDQILQWSQRTQWPAGAARVAADRLHLTLHFIGSVPQVQLPLLQTGLRVPSEAFRLRLAAAQLWPGGIAVLQPATSPPALLRLHSALADALRTQDLPVETRPWQPHVTLARRAGGAMFPAMQEPVDWEADGTYLLVQSLPAGGRYVEMHRYA